MNICFDRKCLKGLVRHKIDFQGNKDILMEKSRILKKKHIEKTKKIGWSFYLQSRGGGDGVKGKSDIHRKIEIFRSLDIIYLFDEAP